VDGAIFHGKAHGTKARMEDSTPSFSNNFRFIFALHSLSRGYALEQSVILNYTRSCTDKQCTEKVVSARFGLRRTGIILEKISTIICKLCCFAYAGAYGG
jgi:hypothetical protein